MTQLARALIPSLAGAALLLVNAVLGQRQALLGTFELNVSGVWSRVEGCQTGEQRPPSPESHAPAAAHEAGSPGFSRIRSWFGR